jgi:RimJ/RimL family protein N-acetyltransferase
MVMPTCYTVPGMELESVTLSSKELVYSVFESSPSYFLKVEGRRASLSTAEEAITCHPRQTGESYRKEMLLIREGSRPIGTAELHVHHPEPGVVYIGLLIIREDLFGKGYGRRAYDAVERYLRERYGCVKVRLGVSDDHDVSGFWRKVGFTSNGRDYSYEGETKANNVVEYEKLLC